MDENTMTLKDFIEYAEVYPYTQDRYMIEKMIMELGLMELHMESYQFLLEQGGLSLSQLDVLMVESGVHDMAPATEKLYCEKSNTISNGINRIIQMITKALMSLFKNIGGTFVNINKSFGNIVDKNKDLAAKIKNTQWTKDLDKKDTDELKNIITPVLSAIDAFIKADGGKILPVPAADGENAVFTVINAVNTIAGAGADAKSIKAYASLCLPSYTVEGLAAIAKLETLIEEVQGIMKAIPTDVKNDVTKLKDLAEKTKKDLEVACRTNVKFTMDEDALRKKLKAVEDLSAIVIKKTDSEAPAASVDLRAVHDAIIAFQSASGEITKMMTAHSRLRDQVVSVHHKVTDKVASIIDK